MGVTVATWQPVPTLPGNPITAERIARIEDGVSANCTAVRDMTTAAAQAVPTAPVDSPALTGTPTAPTPATTDSSTRVATTAFVHALVDVLTNGAPGTLDSFLEFATAINNDPNFATTITTALATKQTATQVATAIAAALASFSIAWTKVTGTPTTTAGYGITDAVPATAPTFTGLVTVRPASTSAHGLETKALTGQTQGTYTNRVTSSAGVLLSGTELSTGALKLPSYTTATRPNASAIGAGHMIYDSTLKLQAVSNGIAWVNALGVAI